MLLRSARPTPCPCFLKSPTANTCWRACCEVCSRAIGIALLSPRQLMPMGVCVARSSMQHTWHHVLKSSTAHDRGRALACNKKPAASLLFRFVSPRRSIPVGGRCARRTKHTHGPCATHYSAVTDRDRACCATYPATSLLLRSYAHRRLLLVGVRSAGSRQPTNLSCALTSRAATTRGRVCCETCPAT